MRADKERWYRRAMAAYPRSYRDDREEEVVSTLLDASADTTRPKVRELGALVAGGFGYRARSLPDAAAGARLTGVVAAALVVLAALTTVVSSARLGYAAGSPAGLMLWLTLAALVIINRGVVGHTRIATGAAVLMVAALALVGGAAVMGAYRSFLLTVLVLAAVAITCPPIDRRLSLVTGVGAAFAGCVAGMRLATRVDRFGFATYVHASWRGNPWSLANLDGTTGYRAFGVLLMMGIALGLIWPRVAVAVAALAVPLCASAYVLTIDTWGATPRRLDPVGVVVAALIGVLVACVMTAASLLHRRLRTASSGSDARA